MNSKPRIVFVDNDVCSFVNGRMALARAARNAGFEVHVACPDGVGAKQLSAQGFLFHPIALSRSGINPLRETVSIASLIRVYRRVRPDIVHHLRLKPVLYGSLAARLTGVPAVVNLLTGLGYLFTSDRPAHRVVRPLVLLACRVAFAHPNQRLVFQNPDDSDVFVRAGVVAANQTLLIKGSGVDTNKFCARPEPPGPPVVMLASRMLWDKGIKEFVQSARSLRHAGVKARFVLVGDTDAGNPSAIPTERLHKWRDRGLVEWWGPRSKMHDVLNQAHIVCLPSIREGLPRVLIEAASCGRALVATDVPGCREVVRNGDNGLLVPVRDVHSLAWAFRLLLENPDLRRSMGARSRERALREFNRDLIVSQMLNLYGGLLGNGSVKDAPSSGLPAVAALSRQPQDL